MEESPSIALIDNTVPSQQSASEVSPRRASASDRHGSLTKHLSRASVSRQLTKRKYAKWQPDKLGVSTDTDVPETMASSQVRGSISAESSTGAFTRPSLQQDNAQESTCIDTTDFASSHVQSNTSGTDRLTDDAQQAAGADDNSKTLSEMDVLYENQRGAFLFGIPLYSHSSLLNFDPGAWMTQDRRDSPVNITNAQLPDPSWEWAWRTWYVDMSGDVDEQGWQYALSFGSSQWHGTHPWFHSFVRRRRWVRLRTKIPEKRHRGRSDFEKSHMLNEDYFTIHSSTMRSREQSTVGLSRVESGYLNRMDTNLDEDTHFGEIGDIPSLMHALKRASIDRERFDALKRFVQEGGEELYYLNDKISEIMSMFLFQASRWQFIEYLVGIVDELPGPLEDKDDKSTERLRRRKDNISRAAETARRHITGPNILSKGQGNMGSDLLDLTPVSRHGSLLSKCKKASDEPLRGTKGDSIKGIPKAAEVGREGHIY